VTSDGYFMEAALRMAQLSRPYPNPPVGALVVLEGSILGIGHHELAGGPHAEAVALAAAGDKARGADLFVTLEPCNHFGRTPPCADAILAAGIRRVVIGCLDPNPRVCGGGCARLAGHGVGVVFGPWRPAAEALIQSWRLSLVVS
jgi:diaminohydroxyphosphoribosylaminopyrimidine deaminase / 5-amino-6-(5-phosphoribosylamino)uracil reductase